MMNSNAYSHEQTSNEGADGVRAPLSARSLQLASVAAGAAIGSAVGVFAGPLGVLAGALVGAAVVSLSDHTAKRMTLAAERNDMYLDSVIGVSGGDMGAATRRRPRLVDGGGDTRELEFFAGRDNLYGSIDESEQRLAA